jgi:hypothetical protein
MMYEVRIDRGIHQQHIIIPFISCLNVTMLAPGIKTVEINKISILVG